jgi:hypothetical protein
MDCGDVHSMFDHNCSNCHANEEDMNVIQTVFPKDNLPRDLSIDAFHEGWMKPQATNPYRRETNEHRSFAKGQARRRSIG